MRTKSLMRKTQLKENRIGFLKYYVFIIHGICNDKIRLIYEN